MVYHEGFTLYLPHPLAAVKVVRGLALAYLKLALFGRYHGLGQGRHLGVSQGTLKKITLQVWIEQCVHVWTDCGYRVASPAV